MEKKLSYEELEKKAQMMFNDIQQMNSVFRRLDLLFKVLETSDKAKYTDNFIQYCSDEIQKLIYIDPNNNGSEQGN